MENHLFPLPYKFLKVQQAAELKKCNDITSKFNLALSDEQILTLIEKRLETLKNVGRIEFGEGILGKLVTEFCSSPYIDQDNYVETLQELQEIFYYFKNESLDVLGDDELINFMKKSFDGKCEGSLEYLRGTLDEMCRDIRFNV